jgi:hypothetical protein
VPKALLEAPQHSTSKAPQHQKHIFRNTIDQSIFNKYQQLQFHELLPNSIQTMHKCKTQEQ